MIVCFSANLAFTLQLLYASLPMSPGLELPTLLTLVGQGLSLLVWAC